MTEPPITVLVPTSPIPSHPETAIIEETVNSVRERLPFAEILVMVDGVRHEQDDRRADYAEYVRRLVWLCTNAWHNVMPIIYDEHLHQAAITSRTLGLVQTPLILFVEHDTPLVGDVPWVDLAKPILGLQANVIRLHHEASVLDEHRYLMLDAAPVMYDEVPLMRTAQWSQRPHIASADFYRGLMREFFGTGARTMIEDVIYPAVLEQWRHQGTKGWSRFKLFMYAPKGDIKRSTHLDGRGTDVKYPMRWQYDGNVVPFGAPNPRWSDE